MRDTMHLTASKVTFGVRHVVRHVTFLWGRTLGLGDDEL